MTRAQRLAALRVIRDTLFELAIRVWTEDGWAVRPHFTCTDTRHTHPAILGMTDDEEHLVHLYPHPTEKDQPVAKTLLHEVVGHILLDLGGTVPDERRAEALEEALWPILTRGQRKVLENLVGAES